MKALFVILMFLSAGLAHADSGYDDPVSIQPVPSVGEGVTVAVACAVAIPLIPLVGIIQCACWQGQWETGGSTEDCRRDRMSRRR